MARRVASEHSERKRLEQPGGADVEVDGDDESGSWDEPAWDSDTKEAAVRKVMGAFINDTHQLPVIGTRVTQITLSEGHGQMEFEDGTSVSFSIEDNMPNQFPPPCRTPVMASSSGLDLVAAIHGGELLGAMDGRRRGATDPRFWREKVGRQFDLFVLRDVPMQVARALVDFGSRSSRSYDGRRMWTLGRQFAEARPFKKSR